MKHIFSFDEEEKSKTPSLQLKLVPKAIQAPADRPILAPVLAATRPFLSMSPTQPSPPPPSFTTQHRALVYTFQGSNLNRQL
jgi:hypothetical protein